MHFTYEQILPFILAILLIWIIPMMMSRFGITANDLARMLFSGFRKKDYDETALSLREQGTFKREPHLKNSGTAEIMELVSAMLTFVRRHHLMLIYPGTVRFGGKTGNLVAIVVTKREIIGLNCFGYSGTVTKEDGTWYQRMNGVKSQIPDPLALNREQAGIVQAALKDGGLSSIPFRVLAVFTSRAVTLQDIPSEQVFTTKSLLAYIKERVSQESEWILPEETAKKLNAYVVRLKPEKKRT